MSTVATPVDEDRLRQAIEDVRSDEPTLRRTAWVLVGHKDRDPNSVDVVDQDADGSGGLEGFRERLHDDEVMYGLIRLTTALEMSQPVKFIYLHWIGDHVPFAKKGRIGVVHGSVLEHFRRGTCHLEVEVSDRDEVTEERLVQMLQDMTNSGCKVIESTAGRPERGFTSHQTRRKPQMDPRSVAPAGAMVEVAPELKEAIEDVRQDKSETQWVLAGYTDGDVKKPLTLVASGSGDLDELKSSLADDQVMYGLIRCGDRVDEIDTIKFVYIYWVGENVKPLTKGKVSAFAGPVERIFSPVHVTLSFTSLEDVRSEVISDKVTASSGSKSFVM